MTESSKSKGAKYGHIKRRLKKNEPLTGKHLERALMIVGHGGTGDKLLDAISVKLQAGEHLSEYELHLMLDVFLLRARLAS